MGIWLKKAIPFGLPTLLAVGTVLYLTVGRDDAAEFVLKTKPVERGDVQATITTTGTLNPVTLVDVGSQVSGRIQTIYVDYNSAVTRGQVLAELDQTSFLMQIMDAESGLRLAQAALEKAQAAFDYEENRHERASALSVKALISSEEMETTEAGFLTASAGLEMARSDVAKARAALETARISLSYTVIRAPLDGVILNRAVNAGQTVAARMSAPVLFQIADDLEKMRIECGIKESDIGSIRSGQAVEFTVEAYPDVRFQGLVSQVRYASGQVKNDVTYTTIIDVDNPGKMLLPGMTAKVVIDVGSARNVLLVPNAALRFVPPSDLDKWIGVAWGDGDGFRGGPEARDEGPAAGDRSAPRRRTGAFVLRELWVGNEKTGIRRVLVRPALSDFMRTEIREIVSGKLQEGDEVVVSAKTPETEAASQVSLHDIGHMQRHIR